MKRFVWPVAVIGAVMLLLPWLAMTLLSGDVGMAACFMLFFAVNPLLAIGIGVLAGIRHEGWWPVMVALAFLLGAQLIFAPGEPAFLLYAGAYLAVGLAAMGATRLVRRISKER